MLSASKTHTCSSQQSHSEAGGAPSLTYSSGSRRKARRKPECPTRTVDRFTNENANAAQGTQPLTATEDPPSHGHCSVTREASTAVPHAGAVALSKRRTCEHAPSVR